MATSHFIVSALKHRPSTFAEVLAQDHIIQTLRHSLERNRVANAYIFAGSRGTGKTTTARIFAKALNCQQRQDGEPCNRCDSCVSVNRGNHPDVIEIDAASNRGIDEIKQLRENARFSPSISPYKVFVIDESHMLTKEANNALLKTLEEPPAHCKFIFATTELHKVPNTILSRCQRFQFRRIPSSVIKNHLKAILTQQETIDANSPELDGILYHIARASEGVLRDALVLLDQTLAFCSDQPQLAEAQEVLGVIEFDHLQRFIAAIVEDRPTEIIEIIEFISNQGRDIRLFLSECLGYLRNLAVCKTHPKNQDLLDLPDEFRDALQSLAQNITLEQVLYITDSLWEAERRMYFASDARLIMEMTALKAAKVSQAVQIEDLLDQLVASPAITAPHFSSPQPQPAQEAAPQNSLLAQPISPSNSAASQNAKTLESPQSANRNQTSTPQENVSSPAQPAADSLSTSWRQLMYEIEQGNTLLAGALEDCKPLELTGDYIRLGIPSNNSGNKRFLEQPRNMKALAIFLQRAFGRNLKVHYEIIDDWNAPPTLEQETALAPTPSQKRPNNRELVEKAQENPVFQKLMDELPGQIVGIRPL